MRNAIHQVLIQAAAKTILAFRTSCRRSTALRMVHRHLTAGDLPDQLLRLVDTVIHTGKQHRLTVKPSRIHLLFCCHDNTVAGSDFLCRQDILCTVRAVGLHLSGQAQLCACLGQRFGCHIGMCNAVDTGRHCQHPIALLRDGLLGKAFCAKLRFFLFIDRCQKIFRSLCSLQRFHKVLIHQHLHHTGQHIHMQTSIFRRCDRKQQVGLSVILCVVLHRGAQPQCRKAGAGNNTGLGMRHRDAVIHIGRAFRFTGIKSLFVSLRILDVAMGPLQLHHAVNDLCLVLQCFVQRNRLYRK